MNYFSHYPYQNFSDYNLDWLLKLVKEVNEKLSEYLENSVITFADPITWDITEQYTALTCVIDTDGTAYLSKRPVPAGVDISNTNYWLPIFNYDDNINTLRSQIAYNARTSNTTGVALTAGDLVFWNGLIYKVTADMPAGTAFIIDSNVIKYTVDDKINEYVSDLGTERQDRINADNQIIEDLNAEIQNRVDANNQIIEDLNAEIQNRIDADNQIIESIADIHKYFIIPEDYGAVGDGVTDDSAAFQEAVTAAQNERKILLLRNRYKIYNVRITNDIQIYGGEIVASLTEYGQTKNILFSNDNCSIQIKNVKLNGNAVNRNDSIAELENMIRFENGKDISFINCEICNHSQSDANTDETAWYLRRIDAINCIDCNTVTFSGCYIHDNHTEQIAIGSTSATTNAFIVNNRCDRNTDAYALFLLFNLKNGIVANNVFTDNRRTFIHMLSNNLTISNNRLMNSGGRAIASEAWAQAMRLQHLIIRNNYIYNCSQGGIDSGIHDCSVIGNVIRNCAYYAINFAGKITGNDGSVVGTDELPWDENVLKNAANIVCTDNIIYDHDSTGRTATIIFRSEVNITNDVTTYGNIDTIIFKNNIVKCVNGKAAASSLWFVHANILSNIQIIGNQFVRYTFAGILLSHQTTALTNKIDTIFIKDNRFYAQENAVIDYTIRNMTCPKIGNVFISNNEQNFPCNRALFVSPFENSIFGHYEVERNDTKGSFEVLADTRLHENGYAAMGVNRFRVNDFNSLGTGLQLKVGDMLYRLSPTDNLKQMAIVNTAGTTGTLSGITATAAAGSNEIAVNNSASLKIGDSISISGSGVNRMHVLNIIDNTHIRTVENTVNSVNNAAVNYFNPVLITGLLMD